MFSCVSLRQPIQSTWAECSQRIKAQPALRSLSFGLIPVRVCFCSTSVMLSLHNTLHLTMLTHSHLHDWCYWCTHSTFVITYWLFDWSYFKRQSSIVSISVFVMTCEPEVNWLLVRKGVFVWRRGYTFGNDLGWVQLFGFVLVVSYLDFLADISSFFSSWLFWY